MANRESVKVVHAALDESEEKEIILRGSIDPSSLHLLQVADYQREVLPMSQISALMKAFEGGSVPDIDLGMRGGDYTERDDAFYLHAPVFIVDGLQRTTAAIELLQRGGLPRLGAAVHFNTNEEWERDRFHILNAQRCKLSPNVLLRNLRHNTTVVEALHGLTTTDKGFVMRDRVCWSQRMARLHLVTALTFLKTIGYLHAHIGPGRSTHLEEVVAGLQQIMEKIGLQALIANAKAFFGVIEESWGIRSIAFREGAAYMRGTFLGMLGTVFSRHEDFWRGNRLTIERDLQRKIATFPLTDPEVRNLTAAGGRASYLLYQLAVDHINSGKRTKRLKLRPESQRECENDAAVVAETPPPVVIVNRVPVVAAAGEGA